MEVLVIGFSSALVVVLGGVCGLCSLHYRIKSVEDELRAKIDKLKTRPLAPSDVRQWKSTLVQYPVI